MSDPSWLIREEVLQAERDRAKKAAAEIDRLRAENARLKWVVDIFRRIAIVPALPSDPDHWMVASAAFVGAPPWLAQFRGKLFDTESDAVSVVLAEVSLKESQ